MRVSLLMLGIPAASLVSGLSQLQTNGKSILGTSEAPRLPEFLSDGDSEFPPWLSSSLSSRHRPWGMPKHGRTRRYDWTVSRGYLSPDGYNKSGIFVNGQFPGPTIEANWGDWIEVTVHNNITGNEGTAIHWHGLTQKGTQEYDGVPSITQCPIAPGASFTYRFRADMYGTTFWHSHYSAQWTAGVYGGLVVYGPNHAPYDEDVGVVLLGDYYHADYHSVLANAVSDSSNFTVYVPTSNNSLINGKNNYNCSLSTTDAACFSNAGLPKFKFHQGKIHRLRLINAGAAALVHFSIDGHKLDVIAQDFTPLHQYQSDVVTLGAGQRTDVLVHAVGDRDASYWVRSTISLNCSVTTSPEGLGVILYDNAPEDSQPDTTRSTADPLNKTIPITTKAATATPDASVTINVTLAVNSTGHNLWLLNGISQYSDYNEPLLLLENEDDYTKSLDPDWNVYDFGSNRTIRIVMNTDYQSAHPMHLHGHQFAVLAQGQGVFDGVVDPKVLANPPRRDVIMMPRYGYVVIQFEADNPGAWSYHCHIAWHSAAGYTVNILEQPDHVRGDRIKGVMEQTCGPWDAWSQSHIVDQIDSGI
ncbi:multicopper oxidase [Polychaeton citri CBS 116435]|uniref:Multicopper oxidase n=1 Tax=Polychaeton citri CBS 116435 TaxID=1314669 RepID=A0A9P4QGD9_9PEZI|nr:multicopper oxidase [Polychaeton citri CBS 116435]